MRQKRKILRMACAWLGGLLFPLIANAAPANPSHAEQVDEATTEFQAQPRQLSEGRAFFVPHWFMRVQGGAAYDVGEAKFSQLVSPSLQFQLGYHPNQLFGIRGNLSGLWARNRYAYPEAEYKWSFVQGAIDAELNLTTLFLGEKPGRYTHAYAFVGGGVAYSFGNDDAINAKQSMVSNTRYNNSDKYFEKLWDNSRWNPVVRAGLGLDYYVTDNIAIGGEVAANMLPDHFNSKKGRSDNKDWHFTAMVGVKFSLSDRSGRTAPIYEEAKPAPVEKKDSFIDVPIEKISFNVNIYFVINQSIIRSNQVPKLTRLLNYLNSHPKAFVRLSGYADKDTGTPAINMRLSIERSQVVSRYLQDAGIQEWRIRRFAKGDTVQPFDIPEDNRVCICFVYDPDNPVPVDNW